MGRKSVAVLPQTQAILEQLGEQIKLARLRRHLSAELVAERAGVSRATVWNVEKGNPSVAIGIYAAVLHALNNMDIVPNEVMPFYCHSRFPGEDVDSFRHLNHENPDAEIALIEWQPIKPVKLKENAHE